MWEQEHQSRELINPTEQQNNSLSTPLTTEEKKANFQRLAKQKVLNYEENLEKNFEANNNDESQLADFKKERDAIPEKEKLEEAYVRMLYDAIKSWDIKLVKQIVPELMDSEHRYIVQLDIPSTKTITSEILEELSKLTQIKVLHLWNTNVTDFDVYAITKFKNLKNLMVFNTEISQAWINKLKKHLPNCDISS